MWTECPRKWGYQYIDGITVPPSVGAQLGSDVHAVLEDWFKHGKEPDTTTRAGKIAQASLEHYPSEQTRADQVERHIHFDWDGVTYRGYIDLTWCDDGTWWVGDHKTSRDPDKWGLNTDELAQDVQALVYAVWGLEWFKVDRVGCQWTYMRTQGKPMSYPVRADMVRTDTLDAFARIVAPVGQEIVSAIATVDQAKDLAAKPTACGQYGGCPHAEYCPRTEQEQLTAIFGPEQGTDMGLKDIIKNQNREPAPLKDKDAQRDKVTTMPGTRVNSPEAPKDPEIAREVSRAVGAVTGSRDQKQEQARAIAGAVASGQDVQDAAERQFVQGVPDDWDPAATPNQTQVLAWVISGTFERFTPTRDQATREKPFLHGRTLNAMKNSGVIAFKKDADGYLVRSTDVGRERYPTLPDGETWIAPDMTDAKPAGGVKVPETTIEPIGTPPPVEPDVTVEPMERQQTLKRQLVAVWRRTDGCVVIELDPAFLKGLDT
jgi:hypothetical protein